MGKWRDLAVQLRESEGGRGNRVNKVNSPAPAPEPAPIAPKDPIAPIAPTPLPRSVEDGLRLLPSMGAPRLASSEVWPQVVADALRLQSEGWAEKALALGWKALHLWGAHIETPGLAVWLCGRRIVLLDDARCTVADEPGRFSIFTRREPAAGTVHLWEYGRE